MLLSWRAQNMPRLPPCPTMRRSWMETGPQTRYAPSTSPRTQHDRSCCSLPATAVGFCPHFSPFPAVNGLSRSIGREGFLGR
jgi:hypothetical protein